LLVVVAIIALLIAMLLPALQRARDRARAVACSSNLKSFGVAQNTYANEFSGRFVPIVSHNPLDATTTLDNWYGNTELRSMLNIPSATGGATRYNWPRSFLCPLATTAFGPTFGAKNWITYSYGCVYIFPVPPNTTTNSLGYINSNLVTRPSDKIQMCDALGSTQEYSSSAYGSASSGWDNWHESSGVGNHVAYRHDEGLNALHFDGHVEFHKKADIAYSINKSTAQDLLDKRIRPLWEPEITWAFWP
jgi:prepilin-type processing-associated H-X9-DG protein